jgi:hypothetical protein
MNFSLPFTRSKAETINWNKFFNIYREPVITYCITPNNSPMKDKFSSSKRKGGRRFAEHPFLDDMEDFYEDSLTSDTLLNTITGLFSKFYLPERIRLTRDGVKVKLNDVVSYKIVFQNGTMKFYLTVPEKWAKNFTNAIKKDWGNVDINQISTDVVDLNPKQCRASSIVLRHHHCLSIKLQNPREGVRDTLYSSLSSLGSTLSKDDKLIVDLNIKPLANSWKDEAIKEYRKAKRGKAVPRKETSFGTIVQVVLGFADSILGEVENFFMDLFSSSDDKKDDGKQEDRKYSYSDEKLHANANGFQVQIKAIAESDDSRKTKHILKGVQNCFQQLDGDNKFVVKQIRTKRGIKNTVISVVNNKPLPMYGKDIFCEKEMNQLFKIPSKQTLKEFKKIIDQDNFTRTEISEDFFKEEVGALPFATSLDKEPRTLNFPNYEREDWSVKGRKVDKKTQLDDRCTETLVFGKKGSGKTEISVNQILETFLAGFSTSIEEWKRKSKSVFAFDVADGEILTKVWNRIPSCLRHRVIILNHAVPERPIPINFSELEEFNRVTLKDPDYSYRLAEIEADLITEILKVDQSMSVERWFKYALQSVHYASPDWGIPEAIKMLVDDDFRINEVMPLIFDDPEMLLEMEAYNEMSANKENGTVVTTIQNRLQQVKAERKLWDCIAQKPLRDAEGKAAINFRKWADGDIDGAYLVLVYIPKDASQKFRKFLFAHYFIKIWSVAISREKGFAGREYRPETLVVIDEIHQIVDVPVVARIFIDLFKEVRKYSFRFWFTLHGWSSLAKAGRGLEGDLKQSILDNGANLIMLKGGEDAFDSLSNFMGDMTMQDYNNLMNMQWTGIFSIWWGGQHVFQAKMLPESSKRFRGYDKWDLYDLSNYISPYSRSREEVRRDNLNRVANLLKNSIKNGTESGTMSEGQSWEDIDEENI